MYSVLLFDEKTHKDFDQFRPLFARAMESGTMGECEWDTHILDGTVEQTIPKLYETIGYKKEWRAIVVTTDQVQEKGPLAVDPRNPFDYIAYRNLYLREVKRVREETKAADEAVKRVRDGLHDLEKQLEEAKAADPQQPWEIERIEKNLEYYRESYAEKLSMANHNYDLILDENHNMREESHVPIVRLAQMLGGVPNADAILAPYHYEITGEERTEWFSFANENAEPEFFSDQEINKVDYVETHIPAESREGLENVKWATKDLRDRNAEELVSRLKEKYQFAANPPKEIILIAVRPKFEETEVELRESWANYDETQCSKFWFYNHYPQNCRFMTFDIQKRGKNQKKGDLLRLWLAVSMIVTNKLDPSSVQSQRLYRLAIHLDRELLGDAIQQTAIKLLAADSYLRKSIELDMQHRLNDQIDPPDYYVSVPVDLEDKRIGTIIMNSDPYELTAREEEKGDTDIWFDDRQECDEKLRKYRRMTSREVESSALRMRGLCYFDKDDVEPLSDFQMHEFTDSLKKTYQDVLDNQTSLGISELHEKVEEREEQHKNVISIMRQRMTSSLVVKGYVITEVLMFLVILPAVIHAYSLKMNVLKPVLISLLAGAVIYFIALVLVVFRQNGELKKAISGFNDCVSAIQNLLRDNAKAYSNFLSSVGSHMKGSSYLNELTQKEFLKEDQIERKRKDRRRIREEKDILAEWAKAVYINCDFELLKQNVFDEEEMEGAYIPEMNYLWTLGSDDIDYRIPLNRSGLYLFTNFRFIKRIEILREDIYDKDPDDVLVVENTIITEEVQEESKGELVDDTTAAETENEDTDGLAHIDESTAEDIGSDISNTAAGEKNATETVTDAKETELATEESVSEASEMTVNKQLTDQKDIDKDTAEDVSSNE